MELVLIFAYNIIMIALSILALFGLFVLNLVLGMYFGFGGRHYWFPEVLHFLGGFFVAMFFFNFFGSAGQILLILGVITFFWELLEFLIAKIPSWTDYVKTRFKLKKVDFELRDTVFDVALNFAGTALFLYIFS